MSFYHLSPMGNPSQSFFGQMQQMNDIMNGMMFPNFGSSMIQSPLALPPIASPAFMCPFPFPPMEVKFEGMGLAPPGSGHSYSTSTVLRVSNGPDGRPQVYEAHSSTRVAPGGIRETKKSECDTRSGMKKLAIGHHIGERAHIMERQQNLLSGEQEEHEEYINISEDEAEDFGREFQAKVRSSIASVSNSLEMVPRTRFVPAEGHSVNQCHLGGIGNTVENIARLSLDAAEGMSGRNPQLAILPNLSTSNTAPVVEEERPKKRLHDPEAETKIKSLKLTLKKKGKFSRRVNKKK